MPFVVQCPECEDIDPRGCGLCGGEGQIKVPHCPQRELTEDEVMVMEVTDLWDKGTLPEPSAPGGYWGQDAHLAEAVRFVRRERSVLMAELRAGEED